MCKHVDVRLDCVALSLAAETLVAVLAKLQA